MNGRVLEEGLLKDSSGSLPSGWKVETDAASGRKYYVETSSGTTSFHPPPPPLPLGWIPFTDPSTNVTIFKNPSSGQTLPYPPPPPPSSPPVPAFSVAAYNIEGLFFEIGDWSVEANLAALKRAQPGGKDWPDLIALTEVPVCPADPKSCAACGGGNPLLCSSHVGATVQAILAREGFDGAIYLSSKRKGDDAADLRNSVGAFFRRGVFQYAPAGRDGRGGKALFVDLGGKFDVGVPTKKGFVLLPLMHIASGALLLFVAVHTSVPMDSGAFNPVAQRGEIDQLQSKVQTVLDNYPGMSVVLAGDFNARGRAASGQQADALDRAAEMGYRSAYCEVLGHEPRYTSVATAFRYTIDYCLFQNGLGGRRALVPVGVWDVDDLGGAAVFQPLAHKVKGRFHARECSRPSDHLPIVAVFALL